ncbi:NUDIX-family hydrolase [Erwinia piriflorinigrans CFBP 5888]|uniref:NUDIX-family hydrolase n=1 Tax=Erwinia piriflorinigrans CFBP 5888 TaxID=1161919 RepID=V5Z597_9GAMM|nr:NUDIX-family hydrolase [Erwinia piriflorinigrans CFBP 5888]
MGQPRADNEMEEMTWVNSRQPPCDIAVGSILRNNVMPLLFQQGLIN